MLVLQILLILLTVTLAIVAMNRLIILRDTFLSKGKYTLARFPFHAAALKEQPAEVICQLLYSSNLEVLKKHAGPEPVWLNLVEHSVEGRRKVLREINTYLIRMHYLLPDHGWIERLIQHAYRAQEQLLRFLLPVPALLGIGCILLRNDEAGLAGLCTGLLSAAGLTIAYFFVAEICQQRIAELTGFIHSALPRPTGGTTEDAVRSLKNELHNFRMGMAEDISKLLSANRDQLAAIQHVQQEQVDAINRESAMLEKISRMDFVQVVRFNTDVLERLKATMDNFGLFTHLSESLGALLETMDRLTQQINYGIERTADIGAIASSVQKTVERNAQLQEFLASHTTALGDRKKLIHDTVGGMDEMLSRALNDLQLHLQEQVKGVRTITLHEQETLSTMIRTGNLRFEKLDLLNDIMKEMALIRQPLALQDSALSKLISVAESMNRELLNLRSVLEKKRFF